MAAKKQIKVMLTEKTFDRLVKFNNKFSGTTPSTAAAQVLTYLFANFENPMAAGQKTSLTNSKSNTKPRPRGRQKQKPYWKPKRRMFDLKLQSIPRWRETWRFPERTTSEATEKLTHNIWAKLPVNSIIRKREPGRNGYQAISDRGIGWHEDPKAVQIRHFARGIWYVYKELLKEAVGIEGGDMGPDVGVPSESDEELMELARTEPERVADELHNLMADPATGKITGTDLAEEDFYGMVVALARENLLMDLIELDDYIPDDEDDDESEETYDETN